MEGTLLAWLSDVVRGPDALAHTLPKHVTFTANASTLQKAAFCVQATDL